MEEGPTPTFVPLCLPWLQDDGPLLHAKLINKKLFGLFEFVENFE
jgi:hypothetical protein